MLGETLTANISSDGTAIDHHGVRYESIEDPVVFSELYPATNDAGHPNYRGAEPGGPPPAPFLDAWMVKFTWTYPHAYRLRRKSVNQAVKRLDSALAGVPYANIGVPLGYPFPPTTPPPGSGSSDVRTSRLTTDRTRTHTLATDRGWTAPRPWSPAAP